HGDTIDLAPLAELIPGQNIANRAKKVAEQFIASWQRNNGVGLLATSSAPFWSAGTAYVNQAALNSQWANMGRGENHAYHFRFHKLLTTSRALAFCQSASEIAHVKELLPGEHRVMVYSPTP